MHFHFMTNDIYRSILLTAGPHIVINWTVLTVVISNIARVHGQAWLEAMSFVITYLISNKKNTAIFIDSQLTLISRKKIKCISIKS